MTITMLLIRTQIQNLFEKHIFNLSWTPTFEHILRLVFTAMKNEHSPKNTVYLFDWTRKLKFQSCDLSQIISSQRNFEI